MIIKKLIDCIQFDKVVPVSVLFYNACFFQGAELFTIDNTRSAVDDKDMPAAAVNFFVVHFAATFNGSATANIKNCVSYFFKNFHFY